MSSKNIIIMAFLGGLGKAPTFLVPIINPPFADNSPHFLPNKICKAATSVCFLRSLGSFLLPAVSSEDAGISAGPETRFANSLWQEENTRPIIPSGA